MPAEFNPVSRDEQPEENLPEPASHRRRWLVAGAAAVAVALVGSAIALVQGTASASTGVPAAASSTASATPRPHGTTGQPRPGGPFAGQPLTPLLAGTVKSASGTKILITDAQGFTRTIITSSKTVYKDGLTASPKAGTKLEAEGIVDADGTSLDATLVQTLRGPFGGPRGFRPGGPGGPGAGSGTVTPKVRPSGAPTGSWPTGSNGHRPGITPNGTPAVEVGS